ncbi:MAG: DUF2889 domain-containing protein [Acidobacteriota bacterium]
MSAFSRKINIEMDWIDATAFEIRGSLDDEVHSLTARLVVSFPEFVIRRAAGEITRMPYMGYCTGAVGALARLEGEKIGRGFRRRAAEILGGAESCNHLHTLIFNMSASAFQMNYVAAKQRPGAEEFIRQAGDDAALRRQMVLGWMPQLKNSCYLFSDAADALFQIESKRVESDE